jgi:hypothetical protein
MFIATGATGSRPAELVKPAVSVASQMRPDVLSGGSVSMNMQTLTGLGTLVGQVRCRESSTALKPHLKSQLPEPQNA